MNRMPPPLPPSSRGPSDSSGWRQPTEGPPETHGRRDRILLGIFALLMAGAACFWGHAVPRAARDKVAQSEISSSEEPSADAEGMPSRPPPGDDAQGTAVAKEDGPPDASSRPSPGDQGSSARPPV